VERIPDEAIVVRGGRNRPDDVRRGIGTHPSGVTGISVECGTGLSTRELSAGSDVMSLSRVFVDFHNADEQGRLRLNCIGTIEDLARQQAELENGQQLTLYGEDLEVDGVVQFSEDEKVWVATIDWNQIRQVEQLVVQGHN
jgi:hypothetical protein